MSEATLTFKDSDDGRILIDISFDTEKPNVESQSHRHALELLKAMYDSKVNYLKEKNEQSNSDT